MFEIKREQLWIFTILVHVKTGAIKLLHAVRPGRFDGNAGNAGK